MKKFLILWLVFGFFLIQFFPLKNFFIMGWGQYYFSKGDYAKAMEIFQKISLSESNMNQANILYKQKQYQKALEGYEKSISNTQNQFTFRTYHNIGNTYYRLSQEDKEKEKELLQKSIESYQKALDIIYDDETKKNLEFVQKKLKEKTTPPPEKKEDTSSGEENKESSSEQKDISSDKKNQNSETSSEENGKDKTSSEQRPSEEESSEGNISEDFSQGSKESGLSQDMKSQIEAYQKKLQEEQKYYQDQVGKSYQESNQNDPFGMFDSFFGNPFFDNSILQPDENKKDW